MAPRHYDLESGDIYDWEIEIFGQEAWEKHAIMEAIQYLARCYRKGSFEEDCRKVGVIMDRILAERGGQ